MDRDALHRAWVAQAQAAADRGVIECRICKRHSGICPPLSTHVPP